MVRFDPEMLSSASLGFGEICGQPIFSFNITCDFCHTYAFLSRLVHLFSQIVTNGVEIFPSGYDNQGN